MKIVQQHFGVLEGRNITAYTLINDRGMEVTCLNYGCVISKILAPDRDGVLENVVLGFDNIEDYVENSPYFGAVVGRIAGRIKNAEFELEGRTYHLAKNDHDNTLHGGLKGFDKVLWKTETRENGDSASLEFSYLSKDGEEGFPGNLNMKVTYTLTNDHEFVITYTGETDQTTIVNVTNHSYFNLSGDAKRDILNHQLTLKSSRFLELDEKMIPTGEFFAVDHTPFDFRSGRKLADGAASTHPQNLLAGKGYDHPFLLDENNNGEIRLVDEESGRTLTVETDQPGVVLYTSNQLSGDFSIRGKKPVHHLAVCLETQGLPDAIHHPGFPSWILQKGETYKAVTKYTFGTL